MNVINIFMRYSDYTETDKFLDDLFASELENTCYMCYNWVNSKKRRGKMNFFGHLKTITRHRHAVFIHCCKAGIPIRGLLHDLSKYSPDEFISGAKYYKGTRSPNEEERAIYGYSKAWLHHKGRNKHHFEYWSDINIKTRRYESVPWTWLSDHNRARETI